MSKVTETKPPIPAVEFERFLRRANVCVDMLDTAKGQKAKSIRLGQFLGHKVGREVEISVRGRDGVAVLKVKNERSRGKLYYVEVRWKTPADRGVDASEAVIKPAKVTMPDRATCDIPPVPLQNREAAPIITADPSVWPLPMDNVGVPTVGAGCKQVSSAIAREPTPTSADGIGNDEIW